MLENNEQDVQSDSSPELEQALEAAPPAAPSEQQTDTESAPPQQAESQEEQEQPVAEKEAPLHEHPRFQEVVGEKNWYKQQLEQQLQRQQSQQQFQQPQAPDPYAHLTPEEQRWYRERDTQVKDLARREAEKYIQQNVKPVIDAGRMEMAKMSVTEFRRAHSDIKPNSPDEISIAEKINTGYTPDDAYWAVMGPRGIRVAEEKSKLQYKQRVEAKKKANVESRSLPSKTVIPSGKKTARQIAEENWDSIMGNDY